MLHEEVVQVDEVGPPRDRTVLVRVILDPHGARGEETEQRDFQEDEYHVHWGKPGKLVIFIGSSKADSCVTTCNII